MLISSDMNVLFFAASLCVGLASLEPSLEPWRAIVNRAYDTVYRPLRAQCSKQMLAAECLRAMQSKAAVGRYPWWVQTMLRDGLDPRSGLRGGWHTLAARSSTAICTTEKTGTSNWRHYMCLLHGGKDGAGGGCAPGCGGCNPSIVTQAQAFVNNRRLQGDQLIRGLHDQSNWLTFVFLRDPIERFVSGYLDKCSDPRHARGEKHCEPLLLFLNGTDSEALSTLPLQHMQLGAYIDTCPLKWNLHFFPQSLYCDDLGRSLRRYTFRGTMNDSISQQVGALSKIIDARASAAGAAPSDAASRAAAMAFKAPSVNQLNKHATNAVSKISRIVVTAGAARRLLEYFAIDYVELALDLPGWLAELLPR